MLAATPHHASHSLVPSLAAFPSALPASFAPASLQHWHAPAPSLPEVARTTHPRAHRYLDPRTDPLHPAILFSLATSAFVFVVGQLTGNASQVDRLWTTLPLIYSAHFTFWPYLTGTVARVVDLDPRMLLVFALQCCWSLRLTYQSSRRGFLDPRSEDYRWPIVRRALPRWLWVLFDLAFISLAQNLLLLAAELPQYLLLSHHLASSRSSLAAAVGKLTPKHAQTAPVPLNVADALLALAFVTTLALEMRADNEQQRFQNLKHAALDKQRRGQQLSLREQKAVERGFVADGLWAWSRHPNFACEQTTWYILYAFTVLPFLPLSQSITSHPLSTLSSALTPAALLPAGKKLAYDLSNAVPSLDALLTSLEHPLLSLRAALASASLSSSSSFSLANARALAARAKLHALVFKHELQRDEGTLWNYSVVAPLSMSALFLGSTWLTEKLSCGKYPLYPTYQRRVAKFWPVLTPLKGAWLALSGARRGRAERAIWGAGEGRQGKLKQK
ncbi:hypothetical protein Rhopal_006435-T1 [Rhodotorula paludigena]|uniref:DUF1295-domain-containing protein n=1 Tax=Rhodotorula paludigena TaxID=86838 RepID=A0AAV5GM68_9BASI|nr:hypothetical protein Rhopal_006435-T1 [Rhodotorula paludigena]